MRVSRPAFNRWYLLLCVAWLAGTCIASLAGAAQGAQAPAPPPFDLDKARQASQVRDPGAATRAYLDAVPAERRARTKAYAHGDYWLDLGGSILNAGVLIGVLALGLAARMRDLVKRLSRFRSLRTAAYWTLLLTLTSVAAFPLTFYRSYYREKAYGLLTQGLGDWMLDRVKMLAIGCVLGSLLIVMLYAVLRRAPRTWWLWGAGVVIGFRVLTDAIFPVFLAPLFYRFTPVQDTQVRESVLAMAKSYGVPAEDVFQIDASRRTDRIGAGVVGLLGTTRVALFDTTLRRCTLAEIHMVVGHEIGHYVMNHLWQSQAFWAVLTVVGFLFVRWGCMATLRRWPGLGVSGVSDLAGLPLLWLLLGTSVFVLSPFRYAWLRALENKADHFGLMASREPDAAATVFLKLGEYRDLEPHPLVELLLFSHPSGKTRIRHAMEWKAANPDLLTEPIALPQPFPEPSSPPFPERARPVS